MSLGDYLDSFTDRDWQEADVDPPVRFALVGLGWWTTERVLPAIRGSEFCEATVLVSGNRTKADHVAGDAPNVEATLTYEQYEAGELSDAYDAVYVCTPNATHLQYVTAAAENGSAVLCEKPVEASLSRAEDLVAACEEAGVTLAVAYRMHTEPAVRRMRELIQDGAIGDPVSVLGHMSDDILEFIPDPDQWRLDPELSGGTTVNDIGIYPLNTARFVLDRDPVAVYGHTDSVHDAFEGVDEHAAFQVEFPGAVTAACTVSHNATDASQLTVVGTEGQIRLEPAFFPMRDRELTVEVGDDRAHVTFEQVRQMREEFDYFAHCLHTGTEPYGDGEHALTDMRAIEAIYESAETGERVEL